jgi:hypothetical protein
MGQEDDGDCTLGSQMQDDASDRESNGGRLEGHCRRIFTPPVSALHWPSTLSLGRSSLWRLINRYFMLLDALAPT